MTGIAHTGLAYIGTAVADAIEHRRRHTHRDASGVSATAGAGRQGFRRCHRDRRGHRCSARPPTVVEDRRSAIVAGAAEPAGHHDRLSVDDRRGRVGQQPAGDWAFDIVNFVFWVGIGHAGTLICAILFLFRQNWRTGINRFAEAMTIFAVMCAGIFPGIHVGRPWLALLAVPVPNQMGDVAAIPLAAAVGRVRGLHVRDRLAAVLVRRAGAGPGDAARPRHEQGQADSSTASSPWAGAARSRHWHRFEKAYLLLAGLATPLVLSVHSVVSSTSPRRMLPGWHTTIFPPYFVAGAIFCGFAMVLTLPIPARQLFGLQGHHHRSAHRQHVQGHPGDRADRRLRLRDGVLHRLVLRQRRSRGSCSTTAPPGPYAWAFWMMVTCNVITPQLFWFKKIRQNLWLVLFVCASS